MRTRTGRAVTTGVLVLLAAGHALAQPRSRAAFQPSRQLFARLFPGDPQGRLRLPPEARTLERERPANRFCEGCEDRPGSAHLVLDSPRLNDAWLSRHTYQSNGSSFGDNTAIADFWYDAVHRRIFSRSLVLHEVADPADLRLGRAPGTYPNAPDFTATLPPGTTVGHVGFIGWSQNGFGAYFAAVQGAVRDARSGYLDFSTVTGEEGRTRTGSTYSPEDLIKHVRLHPSGQLEVGFETNPAARPDPVLLVRGGARVEDDLAVEGTAVVSALTSGTARMGAGGNVPHACTVREGGGDGRRARAQCEPGQLAIGGGGACASGELRESRPVQTDAGVDTWEVGCSRNGAHAAYVICCAR